MSSPPPIIHIVDDDETFRRAVVRLVEASGFRSASYESGDDFLAHPPGDEAGCILLDLQMPGLNGLDLQDRLTEAAPLLPIIFLTGYGDIQATVRAMKAGAEDFLEKTASSEALLQAIGRAMVRYQARLAEQQRTTALQVLVASLTSRESIVFGLLVRGKRHKEIAYALGTSERTVKAHRRSVMEKLNVRSLAEAVSIAERVGLLKSEAPRPKEF